MIDKLSISNFKAHSQTELDLANLNILSGINGVGKSSVFQSLLLLRQSYEKNVLSSGLDLNKPHCEIGTIEDALYQYADNDTIAFSIRQDGNEYKWRFKPERNALNKTFIPSIDRSPDNLEQLSLFTNSFHYLSAARLAPRESYPLDTNLVEVKRQLSIEKGQGELAVHFLYYYGQERKEILKFPNLKNAHSSHDDILSQTSAWEREISPNVNVVPSSKGKSFELRYSFTKPNDILPTAEYSAENVGFGLSYALPIIISILTAEKNSLLLIENPEAHLHPAGQSKIAELLALAASNGVQIILETHSDHILNGILVACKKFEQTGSGINRELVRIHNFSRNESNHSATAELINILSDGRIDKQPNGFFNQTEADLNYLLDI